MQVDEKASEKDSGYKETEKKRRKCIGCLFVGCLLIVPATRECISGMDLLRQFYVLPH